MRYVIALFTTMMIFAAVQTPAAAVDYGSRGSPMVNLDQRVDCNPGEFVIGFRARVGVWVDRLGVVCTTWDIGTNSVAAARDAGVLGTGGANDPVTTTSCSVDHVLSGLKYVTTGSTPPGAPQYVQNVAMICARPTGAPETQFVNLKDSQPLDPQTPLGDPNTRAYVDIVYCPPGMVATGVLQASRGDHAWYFGLACNKGSDVLAAQVRSRTNSDMRKYAAMHAAASHAAPPISAHNGLSALASPSASGGSGGSSGPGSGSTAPSTPSAGPGFPSAGGIPAGPSSPMPAAAPVPGSWSQSCSNSSLYQNVLTASCKSTTGLDVTTTLDLTTCNQPASAGNINGKLVCESGVASTGSGSYGPAPVPSPGPGGPGGSGPGGPGGYSPGGPGGYGPGGPGGPYGGGYAIAGTWQTSEGDMTLMQMGDHLEGSYGTDNGRINAHHENGRWAGTWSEAHSDHPCAHPKDGNYYWGRMAFFFSQASHHFDGMWSYCDKDPSSGTKWTGDRVK